MLHGGCVKAAALCELGVQQQQVSTKLLHRRKSGVAVDVTMGGLPMIAC